MRRLAVGFAHGNGDAGGDPPPRIAVKIRLNRAFAPVTLEDELAFILQEFDNPPHLTGVSNRSANQLLWLTWIRNGAHVGCSLKGTGSGSDRHGRGRLSIPRVLGRG